MVCRNAGIVMDDFLCPSVPGAICWPANSIPQVESTDMDLVVPTPMSFTALIDRLAVREIASCPLL